MTMHKRFPGVDKQAFPLYHKSQLPHLSTEEQIPSTPASQPPSKLTVQIADPVA